MTALTTVEEEKKQVEFFRGLCHIATKSGNYPNISPDTMLNIMMTAKDFGISPMKALNGGFYIVNGKISMSTALMADRIRKAGHSIKIPEWTSEKCVIIGIRSDNEDSVKFEFTMKDAETAGLTNSPTWRKFPKNMLYNRAMSTLARTLFPDVVGNAYSEDEAHDIRNIPAEKRPDEDPAMITVEAKPQETVEIMPGHEGLHPKQRLKEITSMNNLPTEPLDEYLEAMAKKKGESLEKIVDGALLKEILPKFLNHYQKWLETTPKAVTA